MKKTFDRIILLLIVFVLALCGLAFIDFLLHPQAPDFSYHSIFYRIVSMLVLTPFTLLVGFLIIRRVPGNVVGPLLILWSGSVVFGAIRKDIGPVPFALFAFYNTVIGWSALSLMVVHFPDGKIFSTGAVPWIYGANAISLLIGLLSRLGSPVLQAQVTNPFYLPALQGITRLTWLAILISSPALGFTVVLPVLRYRKGSPVERQQIKGLASFVIVMAILFARNAEYAVTKGNLVSREISLFSLLSFLFFGLFPSLAIGIAVLRYHLWDIDIIIRRALVYSILTAILTSIYFGSVLFLQELFQLVTGQHQPPAATVLSTLAIAALFTPIRRRIQTFIDRRFYRRKYDSEQVMATFAASLKNEVDLDRMMNSILAAAQETMQPQNASLWLRPVDLQPERRE